MLFVNVLSKMTSDFLGGYCGFHFCCRVVSYLGLIAHGLKSMLDLGSSFQDYVDLLGFILPVLLFSHPQQEQGNPKPLLTKSHCDRVPFWKVSSGSIIWSMRWAPTWASHCFMGSAFLEGMD